MARNVERPRARPTVEYRGILKHKDWRPGGGFGTLCPKWTHQAGDESFAGDPHVHDWSRTIAYDLFLRSCDDGDGHRYAARNGIAFKAQMSNDGTWHGYPVPWDDVPSKMQDMLIERGQALRKQMRRQNTRQFDAGNIRWALSSDDE